MNFTREIRTQAQLDHPNLVRAYDAGHDGNVYYLVTEYVPGMDLRRLIRTQAKPLTMQHAANIILQAVQGLHYCRTNAACSIGTLNRATSWSLPKARPKCRTWAWQASFIWQTRIPGWQDRWHCRLSVARTDPVSTRYYSLQRCLLAGLHALLRHHRQGAISRRDHTRQARRHLEDTPWHPRRFNPDIAEEFVEIIADMMEKDPVARMQTAAEVCQRLEPWASDSVSLPSQPMIKSPWMPPPLPTGAKTWTRKTPAKTKTSNRAVDRVSGPKQRIHWARPVKIHCESVPDDAQAPSSPTYPHSSSRDLTVSVALAVSIPVSLLAGIVLGFLISSWLG